VEIGQTESLLSLEGVIPNSAAFSRVRDLARGSSGRARSTRKILPSARRYQLGNVEGRTRRLLALGNVLFVSFGHFLPA
jgi:hypothetical protein